MLNTLLKSMACADALGADINLVLSTNDDFDAQLAKEQLNVTEYTQLLVVTTEAMLKCRGNTWAEATDWLKKGYLDWYSLQTGRPPSGEFFFRQFDWMGLPGQREEYFQDACVALIHNRRPKVNLWTTEGVLRTMPLMHFRDRYALEQWNELVASCVRISHWLPSCASMAGLLLNVAAAIQSNGLSKAVVQDVVLGSPVNRRFWQQGMDHPSTVYADEGGSAECALVVVANSIGAPTWTQCMRQAMVGRGPSSALGALCAAMLECGGVSAPTEILQKVAVCADIDALVAHYSPI